MNARKTAWLFPGQGSQFLGMGWELCNGVPAAGRIFELASDLSGFAIKQCCWMGPSELLNRTDVLQPALTAVSLGCLSLLQEEGFAPNAVAGHSLGEYSALCAAGVLSVEDTLRLVIDRGRLMNEASQRHPGGMIAVQGLPVSCVEEIVGSLPDRYALCVANYNAPEQTVLSGAHHGLAAASQQVAARGGRAIPLSVSGAWHSPFLKEAQRRFAPMLDAVEFRPPKMPLYLNSTGQPETNPARLRQALKAQIAQPVRWLQAVEQMIEDGVDDFVEVGPGRVLRGLLRKIWNRPALYSVRGVDGPRAVSGASGRRHAAESAQ
jgi:[acyl-carrier-protein] S-malonyltransferase